MMNTTEDNKTHMREKERFTILTSAQTYSRKSINFICKTLLSRLISIIILLNRFQPALLQTFLKINELDENIQGSYTEGALKYGDNPLNEQTAGQLFGRARARARVCVGVCVCVLFNNH